MSDEVSVDYLEQAQWSAICDFCDDAVEHFCKTCGIKLCSPCKDDHLSKKLYRHHEAVPYTSGIGPKTATQSECPSHPGERCQLHCKSCNVLVCSACIVERHTKHDFTSISDAYDHIKPIAMSQLTKTKEIRLQLHKALEELSKSQDDIVSAIAEIEENLKSSAQCIHTEVEDILAENVKIIQKFKDDTMSMLQEKVRKIKEKLDKLDKDILSYDKHLRSSDPGDLLKFMIQRHEEAVEKITHHVELSEFLPTFTPGCISREHLQQQFGKLVVASHTEPSNKSSADELKGDYSKSDLKTEKTLITKKEEEKKKQSIPKSVCQNSVCHTQLSMGYNATGLRIISPDKAWVNGAGLSKLDLLEISGKVVRTVDAGCKLNDVFGMCVTDDGGLVYSDFNNECIRSLSPRGEVRTLFTTKGSKPRGLCRLQNDKLVVGMDGGEIRIYSTNGRVVRKIKNHHTKDPRYITINKHTGNICMSDNWEKVVVMKTNGDHKFTYSKDESGGIFNPRDLCSDRQGRLLITDIYNNCIHIVDQEGQFIQYLITVEDGIDLPVSIDVDDRGYAWVGEYQSKKVKIIKYS